MQDGVVYLALVSSSYDVKLCRQYVLDIVSGFGEVGNLIAFEIQNIDALIPLILQTFQLFDLGVEEYLWNKRDRLLLENLDN